MTAKAMSKTLLILSAALCAAACSRGMSAREREQAEAAERNRIDPKIQADWDNLVNESRPAMAFVNNTLNEVREIQRAEAEADAANKQSGK